MDRKAAARVEGIGSWWVCPCARLRGSLVLAEGRVVCWSKCRRIYPFSIAFFGVYVLSVDLSTSESCRESDVGGGGCILILSLLPRLTLTTSKSAWVKLPQIEVILVPEYAVSRAVLLIHHGLVRESVH